MAKNSSDELTNYQRYLNNVNQRGYTNLPIPDHIETIAELIAEGDRLLKQEAKAKAPKAARRSTKPKEVETSNNPYRQARLTILSEMDSEKRNLIERLEKEGKTDSPQYKDFVTQIQKLGDKLSQ